MDMGLSGKVAVITGASDGIGKAAAMSMAQEDVKVVICARRADNLAKAAEEIQAATGNEVMTVTADITSQSDIDALFEKVVEVHGRVDILVNNAGTSAAAVFDAVSDETWKYDIELKVFGAIRCSLKVIPLMKAQGGGRIINITTPGGKAPAAASVPTSVSRAAGIALTKEMSKDYAKDNILVNTVCIGLIKSMQHERRWEVAHEKDSSVTLESWYENMGKRVPLGRVGETREAGDLITFLVSERAAFITGVSVNVDGGASPVV
jgi:NAD(P)-dependent dehydrogenase (short-subunit alcohol dehydrogenase family)